MKVFFLMTDTALATWLTFATSTLALIASVFLTVRTSVIAKRQTVNLTKIDAIATKQTEIHSQIDGMQDKLIAANKIIDTRKGNDEGRAELKQEQSTDK